MNCKEDENVNNFTIYCRRMELTVVRPVGQSSRGFGWGWMSGRRLPAHERPRDTFLLPLWKEQTFHAITGRNLPGLLFLQGWLFVRKRYTGGTKNLGLGKGSLPQQGQSAVGRTALTPGMEKKCWWPTPDSSSPTLQRRTSCQVPWKTPEA